VIENVVEGFENAVREPVLAHELPDVFLRVELRRTRRQRQERDILRHLESFRAMPSGLIEEENGMRIGCDFRCDLVEMKLHGFGVGVRQSQRRPRAAGRADGPEQVGALVALIGGLARA
jgi:hypothetical protein